MNKYGLVLKPGIRQAFKIQRWGKLLQIEIGAVPYMSFSELERMYDRTGVVYMDRARRITRRDKNRFARKMFLQSLSPKKRQQLRSRVYFGKARVSRYARRVSRVQAMYDNVTKNI
jgi:hypothetical protein